jgi:hypothetical protein
MYSAILANVARHITLTAEECAVFTALLVPQYVARAGLVGISGAAAPAAHVCGARLRAHLHH